LIKKIKVPTELKWFVQRRLDSFIRKLDITVIQANEVHISSIVDHYFKNSPPFSKEGKKKYEFPDAIALMSIENWARNNDRKILAISDDQDWMNYSETSERISVEKDLAIALEGIQEDIPHFKETVIKLLEKLDTPEYMEQRKIIENYIH